MADRPRIRATARVLVVDGHARVLLLGARPVDPATPPGPVLYWHAPGGAIEPPETVRQAAARELAEGIGLVVDQAALEGPVWLRRAVAPLRGETIDARETYVAVRVVGHRVDVRGRTGPAAHEGQPYRWWDVAEIAAGDEVFVPEGLAACLPELLAGPWTGPPRVLP